MRIRAAVIVLIAGACGSGSTGKPDGAVAADAPPPIDAAVIDAVPPVHCALPPADGGVRNGRIYLAFDGVSLIPSGFDDASVNRSRAITMAVDVPPYLAGAPDRDAQIAVIVSTLGQIFAPWDVEVVTTRPATPPYVMVVFGGDATTIIGGGGMGTTPGDCTGEATNDVALVFDSAGPTPIDVANLAARLIALDVGLSASKLAGDCTCQNDPVCITGMPCTFGTDVPIGIGKCAQAGSSQDEQDHLAATWGCAP
jgi:hypothetical protein